MNHMKQLSHDQLIRYARTISLPFISEEGQKKLLESSVLVVGAGGIGSSLLLYLAASGIGKIGIIDFDRVSLSNLQRQILFETADQGRLKTKAAKDVLYDLNEEVSVICHDVRLTNCNDLDKVISDYDIVTDGSDNYETRKIVGQACFRHEKPLVSGAAASYSAQISCFKPYLPGENHPCYECLYPNKNATQQQNCTNSGVIGPLVGQVGCIQATEVIKEILMIGEGLSGKLLMIDALNIQFQVIKTKRDFTCFCCSKGQDA